MGVVKNWITLEYMLEDRINSIFDKSYAECQRMRGGRDNTNILHRKCKSVSFLLIKIQKTAVRVDLVEGEYQQIHLGNVKCVMSAGHPHGISSKHRVCGILGCF